MVKLTLQAELPDELLREFLQHVRNFDSYHDPLRSGRIHLEIGIEAPTLPVSAVQKIFDSIHPSFEHKIVLQGKGTA